MPPPEGCPPGNPEADEYAKGRQSVGDQGVKRPKAELLDEESAYQTKQQAANDSEQGSSPPHSSHLPGEVKVDSVAPQTVLVTFGQCAPSRQSWMRCHPIELLRW